MDFFEKLGKKATETFNSAGEKANKIAGDTKLKLKINDCKGKIEDLYQDIGKIVYQKYVLDGSLDIKEEIEEQLGKIKEYTDQIEGYEKERLELADMKQCEICKNKIERSAKFCPECGTKQPEEPAQEVEVVEESSESEEEKTEEVSSDAEEIVAEFGEEDKENKDEQ